MSDVLSIEVRNARRNFVAARVCRNLSDMHLHDTFTVCLMRKGLIEFNVRDKVLRAKPGDVFVIHPFEVHWGGNPVDPIEYDVFYVGPELMNDWTGHAKHRDGFAQLAQPVIRDRSLTKPIFEAVDRTAHGAIDSDAEGQIADAIANMFDTLQDGVRSTGLPLGVCRSIEEACEIIHRNTGEEVNLEKLASEVGVSRFHFSRLFRQVTGTTPSMYLRHYRLAQATRAILAGDSFAGAAIDAGFSDQAHMNRTFKSVYGFTPKSIAP